MEFIMGLIIGRIKRFMLQCLDKLSELNYLELDEGVGLLNYIVERQNVL